MRPFSEWYLDYNVSTFILLFPRLGNASRFFLGKSIGPISYGFLKEGLQKEKANLTVWKGAGEKSPEVAPTACGPAAKQV